MVSLTGDTATGKEIAAAAAQTVKRVHLELGGKAPVVVFDDADLDAVAEARQARRLLQQRPGLHGRDARHRRLARSTTSCWLELVPAVAVAQGRQSGRRRDARHGAARQQRAARPGRRVRRSGARLRREVVTGGSANGHGGKGFFYDPTIVTDVEPGLRDHPAGGLRPGRHGPALQRRRRGDRAGRTACPTASRRRSGRATSSGRSTRHAGCATARSGSTTT